MISKSHLSVLFRFRRRCEVTKVILTLHHPVNGQEMNHVPLKNILVDHPQCSHKVTAHCRQF